MADDDEMAAPLVKGAPADGALTDPLDDDADLDPSWPDDDAPYDPDFDPDVPPAFDDGIAAPPDPNAPPPPSTPDTPSAAAERRTAYERQVNSDWEVFISQANQVAFIEHRLAGRDVKMVAYDEDGNEYDAEAETSDTEAYDEE